MSFDSFASLKASIRDFSHRNDMPDERISDYIAMAESEMYAPSDDPRTGLESDPLRLRSMEVRAEASLSTSSRFLELPPGFIEMRRLKLNLDSGDADIKFMTPEQIPINVSGMPRFFAVTSQLEFDRVPDSTYTIEMQYFKKLDPLSDDNTSNAILADSPTVYLYGGLWALYTWTNQDVEAADMFTKFIGAIQGANKRDRKGRYGSAPRIRMERAIP